jgi:HEAT repeat protein
MAVFRQLKAHIRMLLAAQGPGLESALLALPARQAVNPLFSLLHDSDPLMRWRTVSAMGLVVAGIADRQIESARVVVRRLLWNLNDESGGIGWGSPEALGEILARHGGLAKEYARFFLSFLQPEGNFIEHPLLQRGVLWGLGRTAHKRPCLMTGGAALLAPFLHAPDASLRGLAAWGAGALQSPLLVKELSALREDDGVLSLYRRGRIETTTVARLAGEALVVRPPPALAPFDICRP